jgi:hypothetical protein
MEHALHEALSSAEIPHEAHRWHFGVQDTQAEHDDSAWLQWVADRGWLVVTRDKNIRYRVNELAAMRKAKLHVFVFTQTMTGRGTGELLVKCYPSIERLARTIEPPAFFSLARSGGVNQLKMGR